MGESREVPAAIRIVTHCAGSYTPTAELTPRESRYRVFDSGRKGQRVLEVSLTAIEATRNRLGQAAERVRWSVGDITSVDLPPNAYDVWHDCAVFHFLKRVEHCAAYLRQVAKTIRSGGHVLVSTFGPEGPTKCSGLEVVRYDEGSLHAEFGRGSSRSKA